jgi:hypothetical protein
MLNNSIARWLLTFRVGAIIDTNRAVRLLISKPLALAIKRSAQSSFVGKVLDSKSIATICFAGDFFLEELGLCSRST